MFTISLILVQFQGQTLNTSMRNNLLCVSLYVDAFCLNNMPPFTKLFWSVVIDLFELFITNKVQVCKSKQFVCFLCVRLSVPWIIT